MNVLTANYSVRDCCCILVVAIASLLTVIV
jgi:hypothetical protein